MGEFSENQPDLSEKEKNLEEIRSSIEGIGDGLGLEIDQGIKETVAVFIANGLPTVSSCEGHADRALPVPWVDVSAPNQPKETFIGETETFEKVAQKYGITAEEVRTAKNETAYWEADKEYTERGLTPEYQVWEGENKKLRKKAAGLLKEFYFSYKQGLKSDQSVELKIREVEGMGFRIHNGGEDYDDVIGQGEVVSEERKQKRAEKLAIYKKEMDEFTEFLKRKYLQEN